MIMQIVEAAKAVCLEAGQEATDDDVEEVKDAISALVGDETCLTSSCKNIIAEQTALARKIIVDEISSCTGVALDSESCVVSKALEGVLFSVTDSISNDYYGQGMHRFLKNIEEKGIAASTDVCVLPPIDDSIINGIMNEAEKFCVAEGREVTDNITDDVINAITLLLSDDSCLRSMCEESVEKAVQDIPTYDFKTMAMKYIFSCANIEIDQESCLQTSLVEEMMKYENEYKPKNHGSGRRVISRHVKARGLKSKSSSKKSAKNGRRKLSSTKAPEALSTKVPAAYSTKIPIAHSTKLPSTQSTKLPISSSTKAPGTGSTKSPKRISTKIPTIPSQSPTVSGTFYHDTSRVPTRAPATTKAPSIPSQSPMTQNNSRIPTKIPSGDWCPIPYFDFGALDGLLKKVQGTCTQKGIVQSNEDIDEAKALIQKFLDSEECHKQCSKGLHVVAEHPGPKTTPPSLPPTFAPTTKDTTTPTISPSEKPTIETSSAEKVKTISLLALSSMGIVFL